MTPDERENKEQIERDGAAFLLGLKTAQLAGAEAAVIAQAIQYADWAIGLGVSAIGRSAPAREVKR